MRPAVLSPLFASVTSLPGVGPKLERLYAKLLERDMPRVVDLLLHLPTGAIDRRARPKLNEVLPGQVVTVAVQVEEHRPAPRNRPRAPYRIVTSDDTGVTLTLTYFSARPDYLEKLLPVGETRYVSGTAEFYDGMLQMVHPDRVVDEQGFATLPLVEPVYPLTEGLALGNVRRAMEGALGKLPPLPEWQDAAWVSRERLPAFADALRAVHRPHEPHDLAPESLAWIRLAYDELLAGQLALALVRAHMRRIAGRGTSSEGRLRARILKALPYTLTHSQQKAVDDITTDLAKPHRMLRLLQGDVGSGKTVVAFSAAATVIEAGRQAAFMAPTEILARQHLKTIAPLAEAAGIRVALLTGRERGATRKEILDRLVLGDLDLIVGTHALFQDDVAFHDLALAVVDEQHRFGVHQRLALTQKGDAVDVLVLTATPIPRTLVLTYFGDMDISELREKPAGRQPIDTRTVPLDRLEEVEDAIGRAIGEGKRAYWVCPLVEESEKSDLAAAQQRYEELRQKFGDKVDLVHGQMKGADKDAAMARFASGQSQLLVATTVIEVGVDVPEATIIVIEHAERFGLAQIHQLRGRVGRGTGKSTCLLLFKAPLGETAKARLAILRETEDGFRIAEEDLRLRGEGDLLGTRQSGVPGFAVARLEVHGKYLGAARDDAALILSRDPQLQTERGEALRHLLYLFGKDEAIKLIRAG
ncbi:ATP-dependent DNA helicase RecG [Pseudolabrys taiwanensis]|uniref:Probable DNA 3'-5' helicase RecG n=1 Tax=Pseudolabrys taiwanensis TaxID=331696 RepID=A0A345ZSY0_9HYPH|nr:ATP-dependent DNA helicase RecG [Pseudolabrys taiwanensis]AXK80027.1 ATP-dependent DNA helicase RecG [Pseudolabrys taiwanensis]